MKITIRVPSSASYWMAVVFALVLFSAIGGWMIGLDMGEKAAVRELEPEIQANADNINALNDRLIYLTQAATMRMRVSWYGGKHHGKLTTSGKQFDKNAFTAASPWIEFGKIVRVTRIDTGAWVDVTITDRGPAVKLGRGLDLSEAAARAIGMIDPGVIVADVFMGL